MEVDIEGTAGRSGEEVALNIVPLERYTLNIWGLGRLFQGEALSCMACILVRQLNEPLLVRGGRLGGRESLL